MLDPALEETLQSAEPGEEVEAVMLLRPGAEPPAPARPVARFGDVVTCRIPAGAVTEVRAREEVVSVKASRVYGADEEMEAFFPLPAGSLAAVTPRRSPSGLTGRGVLVAVFDWGLDVAAAGFRRPDGSTRLLALWDQRRPERAPNPYGYGTIHTRADIDRALRTSDPYATLGYHCAEADPKGEGTHGCVVTDIAAGGGIPGGLAPEADLLFVHLAASRTPPVGDLGDSVRLLEALDFVRTVAGAQPWVVNLSLGRTGGDHSGRSLVERALDAVVERAGSCAVLSGGNYFARPIHTEGRIPPGGRVRLEWLIDPADVTPNELEVWYPGRDRCRVRLVSPAGDEFEADLGRSVPVRMGAASVGHLYHRALDPVNGDNHVDVFLERGAPSGVWVAELVAVDVVDGRFHAWIERDIARPGAQSSFPSGQASARYTTGTIANGFRTLSVGAWDPALGVLGPFSSSGPTRDGRLKPDLVADGVGIVAMRSTPFGGEPGSGGLTVMSGTSMAAPHVTGTVALMFEAASRPLRIEETRALLLGSALPLRGVDPWRVGAGLLDVEAAIEAARRLVPEHSRGGGVMPIEPFVEPAPEPVGVGPGEEEGAIEEPESAGLADDPLPLPEAGAWVENDWADEELLEVWDGAEEEPRWRPGPAEWATPPISPHALYRGLTSGEPAMPENVEVVAFPGDRVPASLRGGDLLLRVAPGESKLGWLLPLADGELLTPQALAASGVVPEGTLPGRYARVLDPLAPSFAPADAFARRVTDPLGYLPVGHMIVRMQPPSELESEIAEEVAAPPSRPTVAGRDVMQFARVMHVTPHLALRPLPDRTATETRRLHFNDRVFVVKKLDTPPGWSLVVTDRGEHGYVWDEWLMVAPPEPNARLHRVQPGESAIGIAEQYYRGSAGWGHDYRFYVNVLVFVNRGEGNRRKGIYKGSTDDSWDATQTRAGVYIWVPSVHFADTFRGRISSGSITYQAWTRFKELVETAWDWVTFGAAFIGGIVHGILESIWDALVGIVEFVEMIWDVLKLVFDDFVGKARELWDALTLDALKEIAKGWISDFDAKWNASSSLTRGHFRGWVVGYVIAEVAVAILTAGSVTAVKWAGRLGKLFKFFNKFAALRRAMDVANDLAKRGGRSMDRFRDAMNGRQRSTAAPGGGGTGGTGGGPGGGGGWNPGGGSGGGGGGSGGGGGGTVVKRRFRRVGRFVPDFEEHGMRLNREVAGTGGIKKVVGRRTSDGRATTDAITIEGDLIDRPVPRDQFPNYNQAVPTAKSIGLPDYQVAHLWGPGFGDEAFDGMMYAPKSVNLNFQNKGAERYLRELRARGRKEGFTVKVVAKAVSHPQDIWPGHQLLKEVEYDFYRVTRGGSSDLLGRVNIEVPPPIRRTDGTGAPPHPDRIVKSGDPGLLGALDR